MRTDAYPTQVLLALLEGRRFSVEYQPVIALGDGTVFGWEALARFHGADGAALEPQKVFDALHASPLSLFQVEYEMKRLQLAHAPDDGTRLFLNIDPDAFAVGADEPLHPLVTLLQGRPGVVVEIIENSSLNDADIGEAMCAAFVGSRIQLALDDIGAPRSMLSLPILMSVDFLKFDRSWLAHRSDRVRCAALRHLVAFARECGKTSILEGIENQDHFTFAQGIGVDCVQGYLFRERFRQAGRLPVKNHP
jgi:EAL domain-containing protein (putative c-di-GMP-specific phosphodiesterase class I)